MAKDAAIDIDRQGRRVAQCSRGPHPAHPKAGSTLARDWEVSLGISCRMTGPEVRVVLSVDRLVQFGIAVCAECHPLQLATLVGSRPGSSGEEG